MKVDLTATERICIPDFLPKEASLTDQLTAREIVLKTKLTTEERERLKFFQTKNGIEIAEESDFSKGIEFDKAEIEMLKTNYSKLNDDKKITLMMASLAQKIRDIQTPSFTQDVNSKLKK